MAAGCERVVTLNSEGAWGNPVCRRVGECPSDRASVGSVACLPTLSWLRCVAPAVPLTAGGGFLNGEGFGVTSAQCLAN